MIKSLLLLPSIVFMIITLVYLLGLVSTYSSDISAETINFLYKGIILAIVSIGLNIYLFIKGTD